MSILIKGMEMPKEGNYSARLNVNRDGTALLFLYGECGGHEAKELPPHGRLIDADEINRKMYHDAFETDSDLQKWDSGCWVRYKMFENNLRDAPTIIEAEVMKE